jgi:hypothetical protein
VGEVRDDEPEYLKPPQSAFETLRDRTWVSPAEKILAALMVLLVFSLISFVAWGGARLSNVDDELADTHQTTLENRAISCRVLLALGQELSLNGPCYEPEVLVYYDPLDRSLVRTSNSEAICLIAREVGVPSDLLIETCRHGED